MILVEVQLSNSSSITYLLSESRSHRTAKSLYIKVLLLILQILISTVVLYFQIWRNISVKLVQLIPLATP